MVKFVIKEQKDFPNPDQFKVGDEKAIDTLRVIETVEVTAFTEVLNKASEIAQREKANVVFHEEGNSGKLGLVRYVDPANPVPEATKQKVTLPDGKAVTKIDEPRIAAGNPNGKRIPSPKGGTHAGFNLLEAINGPQKP